MSAPANNLEPAQDEELALTRRNSNIHSYGVIKSIMGSRIVDALPLRLRCECSVPVCEEIIEITLAKRRELRREYPTAFIAVLSHVSTIRSNILHQAENYSVMERTGLTQAVTDL